MLICPVGSVLREVEIGVLVVILMIRELAVGRDLVDLAEQSSGLADDSVFQKDSGFEKDSGLQKDSDFQKNFRLTSKKVVY